LALPHKRITGSNIMKRLILYTLLSCLSLQAQQDTRVDEINDARSQKEQHLEPVSEPGLERVIVRTENNFFYRLLTSTEGWGVGFGEMTPGAGFDGGPRYYRTILDGHLRLGATLRASTKGYYQGVFTTALTGLKGRAGLDFSTSYANYSQMPYYGP